MADPSAGARRWYDCHWRVAQTRMPIVVRDSDDGIGCWFNYV